MQYEQSAGKCGVCGDPWNGPRDNEEGGKYSNGIIVRSYESGEVISVTVQLTASHKGYFEFKLCPKDNPRKRTTQECLDKYPLQLADGTGTRYNIPNKNGYQLLTVKLRLPEDVTCRDCTFQWKYNAGNSWGADSGGGRGCLGCGNQEQFYGCADIAIGHDDIDEGHSLLDGQNYKKENFVNTPPPPPIFNEEINDVNNELNHNWDTHDQSPSSNFWDALVGQTKADKTETLLEEFQKFKTTFGNRYVRPCVCHSCVGNTCVCECIPLSHGPSYILDGVSAWVVYSLGFLSCLLPLVLF